MCSVIWFVSCLLCVVGYGSGQDISQTPIIGTRATRCYDKFNRPQRCIPEFENAAFNLLMHATNTCGDNGPAEFCDQTGISGTRKVCDICYPGHHHARFLTDFHHQDNATWWQSETMLEGVQWPNQVNLTLNFGKAFDITYVRLWFWSPRPESFYISKKTKAGGPWVPYQYYSATCRDTYGLPDMTSTLRGEEARALCTSEYSDISPLRGGNVAFGTLEGRPSAYYFDSSPELQDWVTATEIMITLDRINTFGDEVFGDDKVLKSYFYAIADVAVGARCKCNGHASECVSTAAQDGTVSRICKCEHNTAGPDCNECLPFYNDAPWGRANAGNANECKQCNCNGFSNRCYFDQKLYEQTGHGGHCLDCNANRDGPNCERCKDNYYMQADGYCISCECNPVGSRSLQCNIEGKCQCKPGVTGDKCDRCADNFYDFSSNGCKTCACSDLGSAYNEPRCDPYSGSCYCKENVEGKRCRECKPGFFNLDGNNPFGCTPCFCYGHSSECKSAPGFSKYSLESTFSRSNEKWKAEDQFGRPNDLKHDSVIQCIIAKSSGDDVNYFVAPQRFLGDQRASYNQHLEFSLKIGDNRPIPSATDVILQGAGLTVTNTIFSQQNRMPSVKYQKYSFRLNEHPDYGWQPRLSSRTFISLLSNLTAIKIRGTYGPLGVGFLDDFKLDSASRGAAGELALWIETCDCPQGYVGQFCESCAPGFRHSPSLGGSFMPCIPCDCNNHASICDSETGRCICQHNTAGDNCELCARGYYGNALAGTPEDCLPCNCPNGGACLQLDEEIVICTECPSGYAGHRCDSCADGFFGDPLGLLGPPQPCQRCECNGNIDPNALGTCDTNTGECLKCVYNTAGSKCEVCLPGYYGNALALPKGDCKRCECYAPGTQEGPMGTTSCDQTTGMCLCKNNVIGKNCEQCEDGYYNLHSAEGCQPCNCDPVGSLNSTCDVYSGQCYCRSGVTGLRCDHCESRKYGFSIDGCKQCECDPIGSKDLQCDANGQCSCLDNVEGMKCDRCKENKHDRQKGCINCPDCYNLVQNATNTHKQKLDRLSYILDEIENQPTVVSDEDFAQKLQDDALNINEFYLKVKNATGDEVIDTILDIRERENEVSKVLSKVETNIFRTVAKNEYCERNIDHIDEILDEATEKIAEIAENIENQGALALDGAWKRAKIVGQQSHKMTTIAHEARELADSLDNSADTIIDMANKSKNLSIAAYDKAKAALVQQSAVESSIREIKNEMLNTEFKLNKTKEWTKEVSENAATVNKNALSLLSEVKNLMIADIDVEEVRRKSSELKEEASRLSNRSNGLFKDSKALRETVDRQNEMGKELLLTANEQQEEVNDLRNELVFCDSQANGAINLWNEILEGAETNYKLLSEFDTQTQKSKDEAEAALRTIADIEAIINETQDSIKNAQVDLEEAKKTADLALLKAEQADGLAKNASSKAEQMKLEAETLYKNTSWLGEEAGLMFDRVLNTEGELKNLLQQTRSNDSLVGEAKERVGRAGKDTDDVSRKVHELLTYVEDIMTELENTPNIGDGEIERLEMEIRRTEQRLKEAQLEEKLETLQKEHKMQNDLIDQYKGQIALLQEEVDNIEQIIEALPTGCYKRVELEP